MMEQIECLESEKQALERKNVDIIAENRGLLDQLEQLNDSLADSDAHVKSLQATLLSTQQELHKVAHLASRTESLERDIADFERDQSTWQESFSAVEESEKSAIRRWQQAERTLTALQDQMERIEREANDEKARHGEVLARMERRHAVERELGSAAGRLKGAAAVKEGTEGSNVVSHFVKDILQDNTNLQMGIVELRELLNNSHDEVENLRQRLEDHQPTEINQDTPKAVIQRRDLGDEMARAQSQELHVHHHYHAPSATGVQAASTREEEANGSAVSQLHPCNATRLLLVPQSNAFRPHPRPDVGERATQHSNEPLVHAVETVVAKLRRVVRAELTTIDEPDFILLRSSIQRYRAQLDATNDSRHGMDVLADRVDGTYQLPLPDRSQLQRADNARPTTQHRPHRRSTQRHGQDAQTRPRLHPTRRHPGDQRRRMGRRRHVTSHQRGPATLLPARRNLLPPNNSPTRHIPRIPPLRLRHGHPHAHSPSPPLTTPHPNNRQYPPPRLAHISHKRHHRPRRPSNPLLPSHHSPQPRPPVRRQQPIPPSSPPTTQILHPLSGQESRLLGLWTMDRRAPSTTTTTPPRQSTNNNININITPVPNTGNKPIRSPPRLLLPRKATGPAASGSDAGSRGLGGVVGIGRSEMNVMDSCLTNTAWHRHERT